MRGWRRVTTTSFAAAALVAACVVPDVELVDQLPSEGSAGDESGGGGSGGSDVSGQGGAPDASGGAQDMAGGTAVGGDEANGGSAPVSGSSGSSGSSGNAGSSGSETGGDFPTPGACDDADGNFSWCESFGSGAPNKPWSTILTGLIEGCEAGECPSPPGYLTTGNQEATPDFQLDPDIELKVSFWARYDVPQDEVFVSFGLSGGSLPVKFGVEGNRYRFRYGDTPNEVSAPSAANKTAAAQPGVWACIEILRAVDHLTARVVPLGKAAVQLPNIDTQATAGEDDTWVPFVNLASYDYDGSWYFGYAGNDVEIDDITVGTPDSKSTCDYYLQASP
jgi:hypothetical protein